MTREEAIEVIKAYRDKLTHSVSNQLDGDIEAFDMAIKALEQEPKTDVLDKIKAEIEKAMEDFYYDEHDLGVRAGFRFALEIIDKYGKER